MNRGIANINLLFNPSCFILKASAIVSLALLKAVSPEVIGQATTPRTARTAPTGPSNALDTTLTISAGVPAACIEALSPKNAIVTAHQIKATIPSTIIEPKNTLLVSDSLFIHLAIIGD